MKDIIVILILVILIGSILWYIVKQKKNGRKCIGCPESGRCAKCCSHTTENT